MLNKYRIADLPGYGKLFVGIFTTLILCVVLWAMFILYVEKGMVQETDAHLVYESDYIPIEANAEQTDSLYSDDSSSEQSWHTKLRHNVGLAHTHINGQTLLFFALGLMFIFTSVRAKIKKIVLWAFGLSVVFHAVGLSGESFHWFFDDILALSGVTMLVVILYMATLIYVDLGKKGSGA